MRLVTALPLVAALFVNLACGGTPDPVLGNGKRVTRTLSYAGERAIRIEGPIRATFVVGEVPSMTIEGDSNLLDVITAGTGTGVFAVMPQNPAAALVSGAPITLTVTAPMLASVRVSNDARFEAAAFPGEGTASLVAADSASLSVAGLDHNALDVTVDAWSEARISGRAGLLSVLASEQARLSMKDLVAERAEITATDHATAELTVTDGISGTVKSASQVTVHGAPATRDVTVEAGAEVTYP